MATAKDFSSKRVNIRKFSLSDIERLTELANNKKISINLRDAFPHPYTITDAENFIRNAMSQVPVQLFAIEYEGAYVGNIGLIKGSDVYRKSAEIGYFLGEPYWNKGIMTSAVNLICEYGFSTLDIVRIHTGVFEYNIASQRVLEKCGFVKEAIFEQSVIKDGKMYNEIRYAKILKQPL